MSNQELPPVIFLAGTSDRAVVACIRSLEEANLPYYICLPTDNSSIRWSLTKYRDRILDHRYEPLNDIDAFKHSFEKVTSQFSRVIIFPESEEMARALAKQTDWLSENDILFPCPPFETYVKIADKEPLMELALSHGFSVPEEISPPISTSDRPFVAKPRQNIVDGNELGVYLVHNDDDWDRFRSNESAENYFYQSFVEGESIYHCALFDEGRIVHDILQKTIIQQPDGGSVVKARPVNQFPESVIQKLEAMMSELNWSGVAMTEFRRVDDEYYLIEINPRFWGPLQLCIDNDVHLPLLLYNQTVDGDINPDIANWKRNEYGYFRPNALFKGIWEQILVGGRIEQNVSSTDFKYQYKCVWPRYDTFLIFLILFLDGIFRPFIVALDSPEKALSFASSRLRR